MARVFLPVYCVPTQAVARALGSDVERVALAALKAALRHRKSLEIAHQQISYAGHEVAFSTRLTAAGDLILDIDIGNPSLRNRIILEDEFRRETKKVRDKNRELAAPRRTTRNHR